ncbi:RNA-binding S4 domain-containing protein [Desulforhopalus vacuolatus]|uniref:RNA-binding S4 domain-containing protein n=1 Tax=Desulforhopalus vacuolatus TaxID=40414 RepID=UPI0019661D85|nr:RNA-binding S4 domain-containing protein [Desulforhopalus vacuolatus]MBM9521065.1 RNA-binding S4 domain-containing protein [Desulforhopalus vacuolatus]
MDIKPVFIRTLPIRLGQFLKFANAVQDGFEARIHITEGEVKVNGELELRRGRQLADGDVIEYANLFLQVKLQEKP